MGFVCTGLGSIPVFKVRIGPTRTVDAYVSGSSYVRAAMRLTHDGHNSDSTCRPDGFSSEARSEGVPILLRDSGKQFAELRLTAQSIPP